MMSPSTSSDPTKRFSDRVELYLRFRPRYPVAMLTFFRNLGLLPTHVVADIGSGTGFLSELFLANDNRVFAVEPNDAMRAAAEEIHGDDPNFTSVAGTAEQTGLEEKSVDLVVAGQAFHWFEPVASRRELERILRPGGLVALIWNDRRTEADPFAEAYEELLRAHATDYEAVCNRRLVENDASAIHDFFAPSKVSLVTFENGQTFDFDGLSGRLLSSSYAPLPGQPGHEEMMARLAEIFEQYQESGVVRFEYTTSVYYGWLD